MAIQKHDSLAHLVRNEAERWGWRAEVHNARHIPSEDDGTGTVVLTRDGDAVQFEYGLPEEPDEMIAQVRVIIKADEIDSARRASGDDSLVTQIGE